MKGEKSKMAKKSTLTIACMLLTVGCTGLQTNSENSSKAGKNNNDLLSNSDGNDKDDDIVVEIAKERDNRQEDIKDSHANRIEKNHSHHSSSNDESEISRASEKNQLNEDIDNIKITKLFDENSLVDRSMPNSQLVLQKLSELKRKQQEILKHGTVSQKKTVKLLTISNSPFISFTDKFNFPFSSSKILRLINLSIQKSISFSQSPLATPT